MKMAKKNTNMCAFEIFTFYQCNAVRGSAPCKMSQVSMSGSGSILKTNIHKSYGFCILNAGLNRTRGDWASRLGNVCFYDQFSGWFSISLKFSSVILVNFLKKFCLHNFSLISSKITLKRCLNHFEKISTSF